LTHPLVTQLRFARSEFVRFFPQGKVPHPQLNKLVGFGHPATTPPLADMWQVWHDITAESDTFLDTITTEQLSTELKQNPKALEDSMFGTVSKEVMEKIRARGSVRSGENLGTKILRTTYHYFFHTGEAHAVRQQLGHPDLPYFVGNMPDYLWR